MSMKQDLTDIVIQLMQLLNSITINITIDEGIIVRLTDVILYRCIIKVTDKSRLLTCIYYTEDENSHYEIQINGHSNLIDLVEYVDEDDEVFNNKYTTLFENNVWLVEPS